MSLGEKNKKHGDETVPLGAPENRAEASVESVFAEAAWLADTGDKAALAAHLSDMSDAEVAELLQIEFGERRDLTWSGLSDARKETVRALLDDAITTELKTIQPVPETTPADRLHVLIEGEDFAALTSHVATMSEQDIAEALDAMPARDRRLLWNAIPDVLRADVVVWMDEGARLSLLADLPREDVLPLVADLDHGDLVDVVEAVSDEIADAILASLPMDERAIMESRLAYTDDTAGRLMEAEWVAVRADVTLEVVARYLKRRGTIPRHTDGLMVVDREGHYLGKLPVSTLLTVDDEHLVNDVMERDADWVTVDTDQADVADLFERRELASVAVVDGEHKLIGRITLDDVIDVIRVEAEAPLLHMAGLDEDEDLFAPIVKSARRRMFWLGINLATAFLAAYVIGLFEATLQQVVALAVLMPIVASMGGIAGSQTLTLAIRGLALGQISESNTRWLALKEIAIAGINGLVWALVVGTIAWFWFGDPRISAVIASAMLINQFAAAVAGLAVPLALDRLDIDPALSGSVILTTVTDVIGFMSFLGLATVVLL